jgi:hypothetical protein
MRKIAANLILPVTSPPLRKGVVVLDEGDQVLEVIDTGGRLEESSHLEFYNGIITPGFAVPCYRMRGGIDVWPESEFREFDRLLRRKGIKAIGVIEGHGSHFRLKNESPVTYHTILELCPGPDEEEFEVYRRGMDVITEAWNEHGQTCSVSCCTHSLMETDLATFILRYAASHQQLIPLEGDQQWPLPVQLARLKQLAEQLSEDPPAGLLRNAHVVMIHDPAGPGENEVAHPEELLTTFHFPGTGRDPDILRAMKRWQDRPGRPSVPDMLPAFTLEAARALFEDHSLGSIEPGKTPGLNLLSGTEPGTLRLTAESTLKVLA